MAVFDALAAGYDASFTATPLGALLREAVHRRLDARFQPGDRVLELGCGTGEDAFHLAQRGVSVLATDASAAMVEEARQKNPHVHVGATHASPFPRPGEACLAPTRQPSHGEVEIRQLAIEEISTLTGPFDGAFSNFGGMNCVADLGAAAEALGTLLRPGAPLLLCVMGPVVPWEWLYYLGRGEPRKAFRRLARAGVAWRGMTVRYPSIRSLRRTFAPWFRYERVAAVGALLPPTYLEAWTARHPRLLEGLAHWERKLERLLPGLADHYLMELVRR